MMKQFQCSTHNQPINYYCQDQFCQGRCLCQSCDHEHEKVEIQHLLDGNSIKEMLFTFQTFKQLIMDCFNKMEHELNQNLHQLKSQAPNAETLDQFDKQLSEISMVQNTLKQRISNRLQNIINAIRGQDLDQSPVHQVEIRKKDHSKSFVVSQAQQQQEMLKKHRQSKIYKMNNGQSKMEETQQLVQQPNFNAERVDVARLQELSTQDWPWKMSSSTIFCCIFSALRDVKVIGFMQPCLYKSNTKNYQKKSAVINFAIYNKKNLTKQPIFQDKYSLRHSKMKVVNNCYEIILSKPIELKELSEYSIAIWPSKVLYCHYFSLAAPVNPFIAFQTQDFNDSPKIKRTEEFPQVISTFRAGLVPYLIIDPRQ